MAPLHNERFPEFANEVPIRPRIRESTRGPRFGAEIREEAEHGADVEALPRENVSLDVVKPEEPREPTEITVGGSEEREEFAAFGPIEDFQPDWGDEPQASSESEQVVPDSSDLPLERGPCVDLAQRVCSQLNLVGVIKQIALASSSPVWKPEDPFIRLYTTCF
jgi:hypothetical protein